MAMKKNIFHIAISFLFFVETDATTVGFNYPDELVCGCTGVYTRVSYVVKDKAFSDIHVLEGTSDGTCDEFNILQMKGIKRLGVKYMDRPDGVEGIAVIGHDVVDKSVDYNECMAGNKDKDRIGIEFKLYFLVEKEFIDLEKINRKPNLPAQPK